MTLRSSKTMCLAAAILPIVALTGCIREEEPLCPDLEIVVAVRDKNYFNVADIPYEDAVDESLGFGTWIQNIHWSLRDLETGTLVHQGAMQTADVEDRTIDITVADPDLPFGRYIVSVWGNVADTSTYTDEARSGAALHPAGTEGGDIYLACDTIDYEYDRARQTVWMDRTKGKLIVVSEEVPERFKHKVKRVEGVTDHVSCFFRYSGESDLTFGSDITASPHITKTLLAPSKGTTERTLGSEGARSGVRDGGDGDGPSSRLILRYTTEDTGGEIVPLPIEIAMKRNTITLVRYVWDPGTSDFAIFIRVNDNWLQVNNMDVQ